MKITKCVLVAVMASGIVVPASARAIFQRYSFTASDFTPANGPVSRVRGSITIYYDQALNYSEDAPDVVRAKLNIPVDSPLSFNYSAANGLLQIGGSNAGTTAFSGLENDFLVEFNHVNTVNPSFSSLQYTTASGDRFTSFTGTYVNDGGSNGIPEPTSWSLMIVGFGFIGVMARRLGLRPPQPSF